MTDKYPELPEDQSRFSSGEVCRLCDIEHHTLRYWTKNFGKFISPQLRRGRKYYSRRDVISIRQIKELHSKGLTGTAITRSLSSNNNDHDNAKSALSDQLLAAAKIHAKLQQVIRALE